METDVNYLKEITQNGEVALLVGSLQQNACEMLRNKILSVLADADKTYQPYIHEIKEKEIPLEVFFRLLYQQQGEKTLSLFQNLRYAHTDQFHRTLALLVASRAVAWLGVNNTDNRLLMALEEAHLQEGKDYQLSWDVTDSGLPVISFFNGINTDPASLKQTLSVSENRYMSISQEAQGYFKILPKAKSVVVAGIDRQNYCWRELYGKLQAHAKYDKPIYWLAKEEIIPLKHMFSFAKGSLLPFTFQFFEQWLATVDIKPPATTKEEAVDLSYVSQWVAGIDELDWLNFLAILLKYAMSYDHALRLFEDIVKLYEQNKKYDKVALCHRNMGEILTERGRIEKAIESHMHAMDYWSKSSDVPNMAREYVLLGDNYCGGKSLEKGVQHYGEALSLYRSINQARGIADVTSKLAVMCDEDGDYELAKRYYVETLQAVRALQNVSREVAALLSLSGTLMKDKEWDRAKKHLEEAVGVCERENDDIHAGEVYQHLGLAYMNLQDYSTARAYYEKAYEFYKRQNNNLSLTFVYCSLGHVCARLEDYNAAAKHYEGAIESYEKMGDWQHLASVYNNLGFINSNRQNYSLAEEDFLRAAEIFAALADVYNLIRTHNNLARVYTLRGEMENAAECYHANVEMLVQLGEQEDLASTLVALAMVQLQRRKFQEAISYLQQAVNLYQALGMNQEKEETLKVIQTIENNLITSAE